MEKMSYRITICSSIEFTPTIIEIKEQLETMGFAVEIPLFTQHIIEGKFTFEEYKKQKLKQGGDIHLRQLEQTDLLKRYWNKIKNSDAILVLNEHKKNIANYIGGNTLIEMGIAYGFQKSIFLYNPIPAKSDVIHYTDEIINMNPVVINKDLKLIEKYLNKNIK